MPVRTQGLGSVDLTTCDLEPIHVPGSIQPHGVLLACDPDDLSVRCVAGPTEALLGHPTAAVLGKPATSLLHRKVAASLRAVAQQPPLRPESVGRFRGGPNLFDVLVHRADGHLIVEVEPLRGADPADPLALAKAVLERIQQASDLPSFYQAVADEVRGITGYDRAMVYRFHSDDSGEVVAESRGAGVESFLGLRYPASDIPLQARTLYLQNPIRSIPDASYESAPLLGERPDAPPLDMSFCVLRSVSPVHREYLRNMGVVASLSLSLVVQGKLWGLIACHHSAPLFLGHRARLVAEFVAQFTSAQLEIRLATQEVGDKLRSMRIHEALVTLLSREQDMAEGLTRHNPNLLDYIAADGVALWLGGHFTSLGVTPRRASVAKLVGWLNENIQDGVFHTDRLGEICPAMADDSAVASGLMALSVSKTARDYVLWFRPEVVRTVSWAGNPNKPVEVSRHGSRLTPRRSFAAWRESVRMRSVAWRGHEIDAATMLRSSLIEVVLQRIDEVAREREKARQKQQMLSAELDLRLEQWQSVAEELQVEARRRAVAESELSQVLRHTVEAQEEERRHIARELHDTAGQTLTLLDLGLHRLAKSCPDVAELQAQAAALKEITAQLGEELSRMARDLRPTALDDLGLQAALAHLVENVGKQTGIVVEADLPPLGERLPPLVETALYRVCQEALTNVTRHAEATRVRIVLDERDGKVELLIEDDGRGFDPTRLSHTRSAGTQLGILGMRERIGQVGGTFSIEANRGRGTKITASVSI
ncbi:MAG: GAF domain-containing protein [Geminicoccaceae bacterium]